MKTKKRLLSILLSLVLMLGLMPGNVSIVYADTEYDLWIGGTRVTSANASDIFGNGKASYNNDNHTLTLNGYEYSGNAFVGPTENQRKHAAILWLAGTSFTIHLQGENSLVHTGEGAENHNNDWTYYGIYVYGPAKFTADSGGKLTVRLSKRTVSADLCAKGIICYNNTFTIDSGDVSFYAGETPNSSFGIQANSIVWNGGSLTAESESRWATTAESVTVSNGGILKTGDDAATATQIEVANFNRQKKYLSIASYTELDNTGSTTPVTINKGGSALSAAPVIDDVLTASCVATDLTYQWYRGDDAISGATGSTYTVTSADIGKAIKVIVTQAKGADGTDYSTPRTKESAATSAVVKKTPDAITGDTAKEKAGINYITETVTAADGYQVSSSSTAYSQVTSLTDIFDGEGTPTIYVRTAETTDTAAGEWVAVTLASRPNAPSGLGAEGASTSTAQDGKITGADTTLQYKLKDNSVTTWTDFTGTEASVASGTYLVRKKAKNDSPEAPAGKTAEVTVDSNVAAMIGDTEYGSLTEAMTAAVNGDTIKLMKDIESSGHDGIVGSNRDAGDSGVTMTLDLNSHSFTGEQISVKHSGDELTVKGPGTVAKICCNSGTTLNVQGGTYTGINGDSLQATGTVNISDGMFDQDVKLYGGTLTITGGKFAQVPKDANNGSGAFNVKGGYYSNDATTIIDTEKYMVEHYSEGSPTNWTEDCKSLYTYRVIAKDEATVQTTPAAVENLISDGSALGLVTAGVANGGTMQYALGTDATNPPTDGWSEEIPTGTDAGTYYVWYKAVGDESHTDSDADYVKVTIDKKTEAHTHDIKYAEAKEPTCTEDGYEEHYECTICNEWFADKTLSAPLDKTEVTKKATGHKWDNGVITQEATYDETGIKTYTCSVCGETKAETIPVKIRRSSSSSDSSDSDSESSGGGSRGKSGSISQKSIDVNGNTVQTQPDSGAPLSDRGGNWGNQEHIWTYTKSDGSLAKGEWLNLEYDGHTYWYYFDDNTIMQTNWFDYNGSRYFLVPEMDGWRGRMATGWHMVDNKWYYFEPAIGANQGILYRGMTTPDGHTVGADGAWDGNGTTPVGAIHTGTTVTMN